MLMRGNFIKLNIKEGPLSRSKIPWNQTKGDTKCMAGVLEYG